MGNNVEDIMQSTRPMDGGGTDPQCVVDYIRDKKIDPQCIVMLTDGCVPNWGNGWQHKLLWCVIGTGANPTVGSAVHVND